MITETKIIETTKNVLQVWNNTSFMFVYYRVLTELSAPKREEQRIYNIVKNTF